MSSTTLCIFAKAPIAGQVKTRLAQDIGNEQALAVYQALLDHTATLAHQWSGAVQVFAAGPLDAFADTPLAPFPRSAQTGANLGNRLANGLELTLGDGSPVIAIGSDCASCTSEDLKAIDILLGSNDAVFGPCPDGGYWALGCRHSAAISCCCASELPWSQPELLHASEQRCWQAGLSTARGPEHNDIDTSDDLTAAEAAGFNWR